jgi:hypothetical protein
LEAAVREAMFTTQEKVQQEVVQTVIDEDDEQSAQEPNKRLEMAVGIGLSFHNGFVIFFGMVLHRGWDSACIHTTPGMKDSW